MTKANRIESLDWLRGLTALSIMFYHLTGWLFFELNSSSFLGRLGIYGVSIFFILSGLSMAIVYSRSIKDIKSSLKFFIRRIFRIWPLFWLVCFAIVIPGKIYGNQPYSIKIILLNLSTLFSFIRPQAYIPAGAWSIGNEIFYYMLTPIIIFIYNRKLLWGNLLFLGTVIIGLLFSHFILTPQQTLAQQWITYINPLNNLFLYTAGIAIYYNFKDKIISQKTNSIIILICVMLFIVTPFTGDQINIVTGSGRIFFVVVSIILVISVYKISVHLPRLFEYPLETLGLATYSVYLLHPVVYLYADRILTKVFHIKTTPISLFIIIAFATIALSMLSYNYFEKPFVKLGKKLTT